MSFGEAIATVFFKKYATFKGRAPRSEFWWAVLFTVLVNIPLKIWAAKEAMERAAMEALVEAVKESAEAAQGVEMEAVFEGGWSLSATLSWVFPLLILLPLLAVTTRRLHDTGRSGWITLAWFVFINLAVFAGAVLKFMHLNDALPDWGLPVLLALALGVIVFGLFMLCLMCKRGDSGHNSYGPPPL